MAHLGSEHNSGQDVTPSHPANSFVGKALLEALESGEHPSAAPHDGGVLLPHKAPSEHRESLSVSPAPVNGQRLKVLPPWRRDSLKRLLIWKQWQIAQEEHRQYLEGTCNPNSPPLYACQNDSQSVNTSKTSPSAYSLKKKAKKARSNQRKREAREAREAQEARETQEAQEAHAEVCRPGSPISLELAAPTPEVAQHAENSRLSHAGPSNGGYADAHTLFESMQRMWYGGTDGVSWQSSMNYHNGFQNAQQQWDQYRQGNGHLLYNQIQQPQAQPWSQDWHQSEQLQLVWDQSHQAHHSQLNQQPGGQVVRSRNPNGDQGSVPMESSAFETMHTAALHHQNLHASRTPSSRKPPPLPVPKPSTEYINRSKLQAVQLASPQPLLLIIDLNGTLLCRTNNKASFKPRANVQGFLKHLLKHHYVMVWSSSRPQNVSNMVGQLFDSEERPRLIAEWARDTLRLNKIQYDQKVQVYKQLHWVWNSPLASQHPHAATGMKWDQSNTILLDDSYQKAVAEPHNLVLIPEFMGMPESEDVLGQVLTYVERVRWFSDVSAVIRRNRFSVGQEAPWDWEVESSE